MSDTAPERATLSARTLFDWLRTTDARPTVWLWCDTPRLRHHDTVGWKLLTHISWPTAHPEPPTHDSDGSRIFGFDSGHMGVGPDETLDVAIE